MEEEHYPGWEVRERRKCPGLGWSGWQPPDWKIKGEDLPSSGLIRGRHVKYWGDP